MKNTRREFLIGSGCMALSGAAYAANFSRFSLVNLLATANTIDDANYKALVCIFLFGGNDANNMLIPFGGDGYAAYASARSGAPFLIAQGDLSRIDTSTQGSYGLPNRTYYNTSGILNLYNRGKLAFVVNMGTLVQPLDRATFLSRPDLRPNQLFSHSDQQAENQTAIAQGASPYGWGGRVADRVLTTELFPLQVSVAGVNLFEAAQLNGTQQLVVPPTGTLSQAVQFDPPRQATLNAVNAILGLPDSSRLRRAANTLKAEGLATRAELTTDPTDIGPFHNTSLGHQLQQISKLIELRDTLSAGQPMRRQIFFASLGGFDTHANQNTNQGNLLTQLSDALLDFYTELERQNIAGQVTTFTQSDFSRTFKVGAQASGTDHAWGSHQIVLGGAVRGGDIYGIYPRLVLGDLDDTDSGANARGRWIPTTSVSQYGATLAKWFGVSDSDMPLVFPNIGLFSPTDLGFMSS